MAYPLHARIRYRDQLDHPGVGVIRDYYQSDSGEEYLYKVYWSDYDRITVQTAHFIEHSFETY